MAQATFSVCGHPWPGGQHRILLEQPRAWQGARGARPAAAAECPSWDPLTLRAKVQSLPKPCAWMPPRDFLRLWSLQSSTYVRQIRKVNRSPTESHLGPGGWGWGPKTITLGAPNLQMPSHTRSRPPVRRSLSCVSSSWAPLGAARIAARLTVNSYTTEIAFLAACTRGLVL